MEYIEKEVMKMSVDKECSLEFISGYHKARKEVLDILEKARKEESLKVPAWFSKYFEGNGYEKSLYGMLNSLYSHRKQDMDDWASRLENGHAELQIMLSKISERGINSYTVEEKRYYVRNNRGSYMLLKSDGSIYETWCVPALGNETYKLTEKEIKDFDSRYWEFRSEPIE